jgi:ceramide galactosyltransferase
MFGREHINGEKSAVLLNLFITNPLFHLQVTMGGTKSHKIPFWELAKGLISRWVFLEFFQLFPRMIFKSFHKHKKDFFFNFLNLSQRHNHYLLFSFLSGHNITFLSGFPADFAIDGLVEITPTSFVQYIQNYTNWDLLGKCLSEKRLIQQGSYQ